MMVEALRHVSIEDMNMRDIKASTRHISMKGGGYYSKATIGAKEVIDGPYPYQVNALKSSENSPNGRTSSYVQFRSSVQKRLNVSYVTAFRLLTVRTCASGSCLSAF